ncbi:GNAT family N-acetyltransferase [Aureibacillus halotolerans]|uniref:ElaA protein n=1 Tax=Aureibacillus halotolerans TaxID=1508390 RepID=A0A4R6U1Y4_9BACI|nr:GNAT family N-acetyltransferase [Aureibacillus halotolerans]TDQ38693.1 ElaA protein [Aureibacillus halotolerans]
MALEWKVRSFEELGTEDLYDILKLRVDVFIVEQNSPYKDLDGKDQTTWHLTATDEGKLVAYARLFDVDEQREARIGRVIVSADARTGGLGQELMRRSIQWLDEKWQRPVIRITAQAHLERFYEKVGFVAVSEPFDEDGILHIAMLRK